ncbi:zinc finger CCHC domain-containing protein 8-like [Palaemon carinicauda]|uniref:zinc finger CCHC domain-containing protein 8-like n=1 Tax=Palaemon carinicauda TaxID=392227 RepID=UPI0035B57FE5
MEDETKDSENNSVILLESSLDSSIEEITEGIETRNVIIISSESEDPEELMDSEDSFITIDIWECSPHSIEDKEKEKLTVPIILSSSEMALDEEVQQSNDSSSDRIDPGNDTEKPTVSKSERSREIVPGDEVESSDSTSGRNFPGDELGESSSLPKNISVDEMFVIDNVGSTDSTSKNVEPETSEKDDSGICPASPVTEDEVSTSCTEDNRPMNVKQTSPVKEVHGIFPANPFADEDGIVMLDTEEGKTSLKTKDKLRLKRLNKPEIISSEEISSSDASTSRDGDKDRLSDLTSMKDGFFLDMDGEIVQEEENESSDVTYIEGVSIDTDGNMDDAGVAPYPVHEIPKYYSNVAGVLSDIEYSMDTGKKIQDAKPKKTCFNCLGDHNFQECPEPSNPQRIAANRKKQKSSRISSVRYHEDCDNKYSQYQPGRISESLREALGLRYGELPIHIYRMRYLGYPPGWLKAAEVRQGEMKLYDGSGKSVVHPDAEEGEVESSLVKYNPDKLINYPGFNVEIPKGYRDDWKDLNFPRMQRYHRKSEFKRFMEMNKAGAYKKRKLTLKSLDETAVSSMEMDIDDSGVNSSAELEFNPPLPDEPLPPLPPEESPASPEPCYVRKLELDRVRRASRSKSKSVSKLSVDLTFEPVINSSLEVDPSPEIVTPALSTGSVSADDPRYAKMAAELKAINEQLVAFKEQLGDSKTPMADSSIKSPSVEKDIASSSDTENDTESSAQLNEDSENSRSSSSINNHKKPKVKHHRSQSKGFQLGAAIPPSITPYSILPDAEKWTVDVSDHINFENLPDALGTWVKMKGLVGKVRSRMCELHADDE